MGLVLILIKNRDENGAFPIGRLHSVLTILQMETLFKHKQYQQVTDEKRIILPLKTFLISYSLILLALFSPMGMGLLHLFGVGFSN